MREKIWAGRFSKPTEEAMERFSHSLHFDQKLFEYDISVNQAWAQALTEVGVYTPEEAERVVAALADIRSDFIAGALSPSPSDEDIHSANERWLTERLGDLGARIHTGRSRNDQVATDVRLYLLDHLEQLLAALRASLASIVELAKNHVDTVMPGYTHLRQAQPISFAHYMMSLFFQLQRDRERLAQTRTRCSVMPLGAGALAGAAFAVDRHALAQRLGFSAPAENSLDATSDRDLICETVYDCSQIMLHLSRAAEDWIIWSSEGYRFIALDEAYTTGSSMMPQKKNPDSLELIRGKTGRVIGDLVALLTMMKGIPTAYVRDLQEDKEPLFDSVEQTRGSLLIFSGVVATLQVDPQAMRQALDPMLYATDMADYLVQRGMPFRQAHAVVGEAVRLAETRRLSLSQLALQDLQQLSPLFASDVATLFDPLGSLNKRNIYGGTGVESVRRQIETALAFLSKAK
ncbi:MAG TPA: argininosuccinate lyase [bacterium]|nr:argininosuccinate lyase [bacterium]HPN34364.1 argininosuccinate lyase [bacterium]